MIVCYYDWIAVLCFSKEIVLLNLNRINSWRVPLTIPFWFAFLLLSKLLFYQQGHSWSDNIMIENKKNYHVLFIIFICNHVFLDIICVLWHIIFFVASRPALG